MSLQLEDFGTIDLVPCLVVRQPKNKKQNRNLIYELNGNCNKFADIEAAFMNDVFDEESPGYMELYIEYHKAWNDLIESLCFVYTEPKPDYFGITYAPREGLTN